MIRHAVLALAILAAVPVPYALAAKPAAGAKKAETAEEQFKRGHKMTMDESPKVVKAGLALMKQGAERGYTFGWVVLGRFLSDPTSEFRDRKTAIAYLRKSEAKHGLDASTSLAKALWKGGTKAEADEAVAILERVAAEAKPADMASIPLQIGALLFDEGSGGSVAPDPARGTAWYRRAAQASPSVLTAILAQRLQDGKGVPVDLVEAQTLFVKAAELDDHDGRVGAIKSFAGRVPGAPTNPEQAVRWAKVDAEKGYADGCRLLGEFSEAGLGMPLSNATARVWYRKAFKIGDCQAAEKLAVLHEKGLGGPTDLAAAYTWYSLGCSDTATAAVERLGEKLDQKTREKAQAELQKLQANP